MYFIDFHSKLNGELSFTKLGNGEWKKKGKSREKKDGATGSRNPVEERIDSWNNQIKEK